MNILITGATGFIGLTLTRHLKLLGFNIVAAVRGYNSNLPSQVRQAIIGDLLPSTDWERQLSGIDTVIHLAARVHMMDDKSSHPLTAFCETNTHATLNLARQAAAAGVDRFIFMSSIKVNGEMTKPGNPFKANDPGKPSDPYGISKYEAEGGLRELAAHTDMDVVIIRPPLVYGPGVKANFLRMMNWLYRGIPLPFGAIDNKRSLVSLDNIVSLLTTCINHPSAANETFLVSDDDDLSTSDLFYRMAKALGRKPRLIPIPTPVIIASAFILGRNDIAQRLCNSLQVDISKTKELLNWVPLVCVDDTLQKTAQAYLNEKNC